MIKAVIFDLTQTLVNSANGFRAAEKAVQARIASDLNSPSPEQFMAIYRRIRADFHKASQTSRIDIWQEVYRQHGRRPDLRLLHQWEDEYWDLVLERTSLFPETERVLDALATRYAIGLVTNVQHPERHLLDFFPQLKRRIDVAVLAGGSELPPKPAPGPFLRCLANLGVSPDETVYIGDDWHIDIRGALTVGLRVIWLQHALLQRSFPQTETAIPIIRSLEPLLDLKSLLRT